MYLVDTCVGSIVDVVSVGFPQVNSQILGVKRAVSQWRCRVAGVDDVEVCRQTSSLTKSSLNQSC